MCQRCAENSGVPRATPDVISYFLEAPADHKDGDRWIEARCLGFFAAAHETILHSLALAPISISYTWLVQLSK